MRHPEPDLAAIRRLLDPMAWERLGHAPARAAAMASACALAWLAGAKVREMARVTLADWRPDGVAAVRLWAGGAEGAGGRQAPRQARAIPILPALSRPVDARRALMGNPPPEAFLLAAGPPWDAEPRGTLDRSAPDIARLSRDKVVSLADLADRFVSYAHWGPVDPEAAAWLSGYVEIRFAGAQPPLADLRRMLDANHPGAPARSRARAKPD